MADVTIALYGKKTCAKCRAAKKKIHFFLDKWGYADQAVLRYYDMDTIDGRAEGAFNNVTDVPTIILEHDGAGACRWDGKAPESDELRLCLENAIHAATG
ncbi:MAG: hypothetical protein ACTSYK_07895 [Alphaproteobacteria bacterium]